MYGYKTKNGQEKKREAETSLDSLARNTRTFRKLSLSVRRIRLVFLFLSLVSKKELAKNLIFLEIFNIYLSKSSKHNYYAHRRQIHILFRQL